MKVMVLVHQFFPSKKGGTEVLALNFSNYLLKENYEVEVFSTEKILEDEKHLVVNEYVHESVRVKSVQYNSKVYRDSGKIVSAEYDNVEIVSVFEKQVQEYTPDFIVAFHLAGVSPAVLEVCKDKSIPLYFVPTDFWFACPRVKLLLPSGGLCSGPDVNSVNCIEHLGAEVSPSIFGVFKKFPHFLKVLFVYMASMMGGGNKNLGYISDIVKRPENLKKKIGLVNGVIFPTLFMQKMYFENGLIPKKYCHIPFGVDSSNLDKVSAKPNRSMVVGFVGSFDVSKGLDVLLSAMNSLEGSDVELHIYGDIEEYIDRKELLLNLINQSPRNHLYPRFHNSEIQSVMSTFDVFVVPSLWYENTPLVLCSALACKIPVIASNLGGMSELVQEGVNGKLFDAGDVSQLAEIISRLSKNREQLSFLSDNASFNRSSDDYAEDILNFCLDDLNGGADDSA